MKLDPIQAALDLNATLTLYAQDKAASGADDATLIQMANMFPTWAPNKNLKKDNIVKWGFNEDNEVQLYKIVTDHTSQETWAPDVAHSLFSKIGFSEDGTPVWSQPSGAHDAYNKGDIVLYNDEKWISDINANTYPPGVYGWSKYTAN